MKILNLYSGIGGNRKLWGDEHEITAVEYDTNIADVYKEYFPNDTVIVTDAHEYLLENYDEFDFIWASPPCQTHTRINKNFGFKRYADMKLYQEIIFLDTWFEGKYCVENVIPYYTPLIPAQQNNRHLFWTNFKIVTTGKGNPPKHMNNFISGNSRKQGKAKSFIKEDSEVYLAEKLGFENWGKRNITVNGNHSPGQLLRNCVDPNTGLMILNRVMGIIAKQNENQIELFE